MVVPSMAVEKIKSCMTKQKNCNFSPSICFIFMKYFMEPHVKIPIFYFLKGKLMKRAEYFLHSTARRKFLNR